MAQLLTPAIMDSLTDDVLKALQTIMKLTVSPDREKAVVGLDQVMGIAAGLSDEQIRSMLVEINAEIERRTDLQEWNGSIEKEWNQALI